MKIELNEKYLIRSTGEVVTVQKFLSKDTILVSGISGKRIVLCSVLKEIKIQKTFTN
jgi:hypothetical protein